jgi:hypothetical protein
VCVCVCVRVCMCLCVIACLCHCKIWLTGWSELLFQLLLLVKKVKLIHLHWDEGAFL